MDNANEREAAYKMLYGLFHRGGFTTIRRLCMNPQFFMECEPTLTANGE